MYDGALVDKGFRIAKSRDSVRAKHFRSGSQGKEAAARCKVPWHSWYYQRALIQLHSSSDASPKMPKCHGLFFSLIPQPHLVPFGTSQFVQTVCKPSS